MKKMPVLLTFDIDGETLWRCRDPKNAERPVILPQGQYGPETAMPRILKLLRRHGVHATFFIPGFTAEEYPDMVREIAAEGHDIGNHSWSHTYPDNMELISLKTRLGLREAGEFAGLLEVYNRFPAAELIVHARTRAEQYKGPVHPEVFAWAAAHTALPLCYNGDVRTAEDCRRLEEALPGLHAVMIGRGLVANPALLREARGGEKLAMDELQSFHDALFAAHRQRYGANNAMHRMKEVWACLRENFPEGGHITGKIARAKDPETLLYWPGQTGWCCPEWAPSATRRTSCVQRGWIISSATGRRRGCRCWASALVCSSCLRRVMNTASMRALAY